jgi:hypothetical protein
MSRAVVALMLLVRGTAGASGALQRIWYRYGDSNPGPVAENHVS